MAVKEGDAEQRGWRMRECLCSYPFPSVSSYEYNRSSFHAHCLCFALSLQRCPFSRRLVARCLSSGFFPSSLTSLLHAIPTPSPLRTSLAHSLLLVRTATFRITMLTISIPGLCRIHIHTKPGLSSVILVYGRTEFTALYVNWMTPEVRVLGGPRD